MYYNLNSRASFIDFHGNDKKKKEAYASVSALLNRGYTNGSKVLTALGVTGLNLALKTLTESV